MNGIDKLRRMLDELGVAHSDDYFSTTWRDRHGTLHLASDQANNGLLVVDMLTPEQAVAVTLGNEREKALEELVRDMYGQWDYSIDGYYRELLADYRKRMTELGLEVGR